jgi:hypothetical protein
MNRQGEIKRERTRLKQKRIQKEGWEGREDDQKKEPKGWHADSHPTFMD